MSTAAQRLIYLIVYSWKCPNPDLGSVSICSYSSFQWKPQVYTVSPRKHKTSGIYVQGVPENIKPEVYTEH